MATCLSPGCNAQVSIPGHTYCHKCYYSRRSNAKDKSPTLSATKLGEHLGISNRKINLVLSELGWIRKPASHDKGWEPTPQGKRLGADARVATQSGVPYVVWPEQFADNKIFRRGVAEYLGKEVSTPEHTPQPDQDNFRTKFPATHRCMDGHMVRSKDEVLIDNWLYAYRIAHAYERKLPIEEVVYSDFYIPDGNVYIEYWGMESSPKYAARMEVKKRAYAENRFHLIELHNEDIRNLDDNLPRKLLRFGVRLRH